MMNDSPPTGPPPPSDAPTEADQVIDPTTAVEAIAEARGIGAKIRSQCAELDRRKDMVTATKKRIAELYEDLLCLVDEADQAKLPFGGARTQVEVFK